ncbi:hypothetical protein D1007_54832 [Hordeum vulgare]|nr:hypothetical protein D1007_54832 [Hordeum vulgare]
MAPAGKQKPQAQGPAPAPPLLECAPSKYVDLSPVLPWTAAESSEHGRTLIWPGAIEKRPASKVVYPFFLHSIFVGLLPHFPSFFTTILNHYRIHALHLKPNSILLLSVFAFYYKAFVGVRPSVSLFRHFFSLGLHDSAHWDANPRLEEPKGMPEMIYVWSSAKPSDPRAMPIVERFSRDISTRRLTGGMIVKDLPTKELNGAVAVLLGGDPRDLPEALGPLYRRDDWAILFAVLPVFNEWGIFPAEGSNPVEVWSDDAFGGEDSEKTVGDCPPNAPPCRRATFCKILKMMMPPARSPS